MGRNCRSHAPGTKSQNTNFAPEGRRDYLNTANGDAGSINLSRRPGFQLVHANGDSVQVKYPIMQIINIRRCCHVSRMQASHSQSAYDRSLSNGFGGAEGVASVGKGDEITPVDC